MVSDTSLTATTLPNQRETESRTSVLDRDPTLRKRATMASRPTAATRTAIATYAATHAPSTGGVKTCTPASQAEARPLASDQGEARPATTPTRSASSWSVMAWTAVTTPGSTTSATIEPTTAKPRRSETEEMSPVMPASIVATSTSSATALRRSIVWSLDVEPGEQRAGVQHEQRQHREDEAARWSARPSG